MATRMRGDERSNPTIEVGRMDVTNGDGVVVHVHPSASVRPAVRTNIPAMWQDRPFAGRAAQFAELDELFADKSQPRVGVLAGGPGSGKSHLAVRYALERGRQYEGGTYVFTAAHSGPPTEQLQAWEPPPGLSPTERWEWVLTRLGKEPTLVIYDNVVEREY